MAYNEKQNITWSQLPISFTVYAVSIAFFLGGLSMMVNTNDKRVTELEKDVKHNTQTIGACCDDGGTTKAFRRK